MSIPRALDLPGCARPVRLGTARGERAALIAEPASRAARATALLVPGFTGSKEDFLAVLAPLTDAGFRVVAYDQRGQFESTDDSPDGPLPPGGEAMWSLAADAVAVADATCPDEPVHLVGHSMGGLIARGAALSSPARLASLTLMCSGPAALPSDAWPPLQALSAALGALSLEEVWQAKLELDRAKGVVEQPAPIQEFLHRRFVANSPAALAAKAHLLMEEPDRVADLAATLRSAGIPALVLVGEGDDAWPVADQVEMARRLGARLSLIPGAGHSPAVDQPEATSAALVRLWGGGDT